MNRKKLFLENIFAYGFINILNKIVPFLLLPVITRILPDTSDYGVFNMYSTIIGFGTPFVILGLYDAMFREFFEKDDEQYKYDVTTTTQRIILVSSSIVLILLIVLNKTASQLFFGSTKYGQVVICAAISIFIGGNYTPIAAPTRMLNQKKIYVVSGLLSSIVHYTFAILLIWMGFSYFGLIYASIISSVALLLFFWHRNRIYFLKGHFDICIVRELFKIGLPLLPTFLIYWVYNSMDKIMISNMLGTQELGIYAIGSKVAQISQLIYAAFAGGWQYFAFSTMKDDDQVELNSKIFEYLTAISVLSIIVLYPLLPFIFNILFEGDYTQGVIVAPYLYMGPLLLMLYQIAGNQFLVIKKSYYELICLTIGAIINLSVNVFLIPSVGIKGAAIATLLGYLGTVFLVIIVTKKLNLMKYSRRCLSLFFLCIMQFVAQEWLSYQGKYIGLILSFVLAIIIICLYRMEIIRIVKQIILLKGGFNNEN